MAEVFEAFFQRADLDRDGRISGGEAVAFFQGSGLPKNVLAQIWSYSDQKNAGFLGRPEFFNALRLVTVAQSGRALTPDIVKAALEGPAAAKIPAPRISPVAAPTPVTNPASVQRPQFYNMVQPSTTMTSMPPSSYQNVGFRGPQPQMLPNTGTNSQLFPTGANQFIRPAGGSSISSSVQMTSGSVVPSGGSNATGPRVPGSNISNFSTDWFGRSGGEPLTSATTPLSIRALTPSNQVGFGLIPVNSSATTSSTFQPQASSGQTVAKTLDPLAALAQPSGQDSKALVVSGNGFTTDQGFGNDAFLASQPKLDALSTSFSASRSSSTTTPSSIPAVQPRQDSSVTSQSFSTTLTGDGLVQASQSRTTASTVMPASVPGAGLPVTVSTQPEIPWPKMTQSSIQKYTKVFLEVDKDRDGRITGEEARNLFLSWRLSREVLKNVWDLSDQDNDGMLSLSEFCIALYLMERYREGRPLPSVLPNSLKFDDALLQVTRQSSATYGGLSWQPSSGFSQLGVRGEGPLSVPGMRPQPHVQAPGNQFDGKAPSLQQRTNMPMPTLDKQPPKQFGREQGAMDKSKESDSAAGSKELENEMMDSKEKLEYYRTKMQDLVLYKSRCDNKLNEITENASASKREMDDLAKRYEEKYKQVSEIASKLTIEETTFRDIQERKLELQNAIIKMEQGGSTDGLLQVRADRIQSDLEELWKALNDRCKKHGLDVKSSVVVELPFGWQPGIQQGATDWDEDWDKFEDEGFILSSDLTSGSKNSVKSAKLQSSSGFIDSLYRDSPPDNINVGTGRIFGMGIEGTSAYAHSEDSERSAPVSPTRSASDSPVHEFHSTKFDNVSPHRNGNDSDHGGLDSFFSDEKYGDESSWGAAFDAGDDTDSVWGFSSTNKEFGHEDKQSSFFDSKDFGPNVTKAESPGTSGVFGKAKSPFFADSLPGTPSFNSGPSPRSGGSFDSFGHFDSFDKGQNLARFDSIRSSSADFDHVSTFGHNDSTRFDSISSSRDPDHSRGFQSFDEADPFGTGPFKPSGTSKTSSDKWSAF